MFSFIISGNVSFVLLHGNNGRTKFVVKIHTLALSPENLFRDSDPRIRRAFQIFGSGGFGRGNLENSPTHSSCSELIFASMRHTMGQLAGLRKEVLVM